MTPPIELLDTTREPRRDQTTSHKTALSAYGGNRDTRIAAIARLCDDEGACCPREVKMIRKLKSGEYRLYSIKKNPKTGRRRNLGTFGTFEAAQRHERAVQYFKRRG
jgi:hypothetical protein